MPSSSSSISSRSAGSTSSAAGARAPGASASRRASSQPASPPSSGLPLQSRRQSYAGQGSYTSDIRAPKAAPPSQPNSSRTTGPGSWVSSFGGGSPANLSTGNASQGGGLSRVAPPSRGSTYTQRYTNLSNQLSEVRASIESHARDGYLSSSQVTEFHNRATRASLMIDQFGGFSVQSAALQAQSGPQSSSTADQQLANRRQDAETLATMASENLSLLGSRVSQAAQEGEDRGIGVVSLAAQVREDQGIGSETGLVPSSSNSLSDARRLVWDEDDWETRSANSDFTRGPSDSR